MTLTFPLAAPRRPSLAHCLAGALLAAWATLSAAADVPAAKPAPQPTAKKTPAGPVVLVSLDGLAHRIWLDDPAARELKALQRVVARGVMTDGLIQAFPSVTPAGHSALWTGAWGDVSGIVTQMNPVLPRSEHFFLERQSGFFATQSSAEPIWVTASKNGIRTVAHEATQNFPFVPRSTGDLKANQPVLISGYATGLLEPYGVIRPPRTEAEDAAIWQPALPRSALPVKTFKWKIQNLTLHGALVADQGKARGYNAMIIAAEPGAGMAARTRVAHVPTESTPPRGRALARHFSAALPVFIHGTRAVGYFRLFELTPDASHFVLMQVSMHPLAYYDGVHDGDALSDTMVKAVGGFVGNGPGFMYQDGNLGPQIHVGGDGTAERRYLEGMELVLRQYNRHSSWVWKKYRPKFLVDYSPYPDEMEHTFYGMVTPQTTGVSAEMVEKFMALRKWGYAAIDQRVALLDNIAGPNGTIVFTSDHGMAGVAKDVHINTALERAGLLAYDERQRISQRETRAVNNKYGVMVNTTDWKGGIVPPEQRKAVVDEIEKALAAIVDPETGKPVITAFFRPETHPELGIGGPAGSDLYYDLAPGYSTNDRPAPEIITRKRAPVGEHGFLPTRDDMLASFIARGPRFGKGVNAPRIRAIDVAPIVSEVLGIPPPADSRGVVPVGVMK